MFQQPSAGGDQVKIAELVGSLVLIYVREFREKIVTTFGQSDTVAVDLHVLDGTKAGEEYENTLIFQKALIGSLRSAVGGDPVLGRIGVGVAKPGQSAPYILNPYTAQDAAVATAWITARLSQFQQAAPAPAAPVAPVAAVPAPAASAIDVSTLPAEVVELLRKSGQLPAA